MSWLDTLAEIRKTDWSKIPEPEREATSREVVQIASYAAAAASVVPIPLVDIALLLPVHTAMVMTVGHVHGRNLSDAEAKRVVLELGAVAGVTLAGRAALSAIKKILLPGIGGMLAAPAAFAVTWALGRVSNAYFKDPGLSRDDLKKVFSEAFREGKASFTEDKLEDFEAEQRPTSDEDGAAGEPPVEGRTEDAPGESREPESVPPEGRVRTRKRSL